jgi:hypothetical protein
VSADRRDESRIYQVACGGGGRLPTGRHRVRPPDNLRRVDSNHPSARECIPAATRPTTPAKSTIFFFRSMIPATGAVDAAHEIRDRFLPFHYRARARDHV